MQLQDYIFYYHSNYLKNYKEIMRVQRARNALVVSIVLQPLPDEIPLIPDRIVESVDEPAE